VKYLIGTQELGIKFQIDRNKGLEAFADANFANDWNKDEPDDMENVLSKTCYIIYYMGVPIVWASKLQTKIALSTTEAEYMALSKCLKDVIPIMNLMREISDYLTIKYEKPIISCKVFEDNESAIKVAKAPIMTPRTKHIALEYHHFRDYITKGLIEILPIRSKDQNADILTKPLGKQAFEILREKLLGQ